MFQAGGRRIAAGIMFELHKGFDLLLLELTAGDLTPHNYLQLHFKLLENFSSFM